MVASYKPRASQFFDNVVTFAVIPVFDRTPIQLSFASAFMSACNAAQSAASAVKRASNL